jgi:hypothetical protein
VAVVRDKGGEQVDEANTKELGNHKRTTTKTIDLESAAASVGHHASLRVEQDPVELLLQTQRIQTAEFRKQATNTVRQSYTFSHGTFGLWERFLF